jgi:hypothetical protein
MSWWYCIVIDVIVVLEDDRGKGSFYGHFENRFIVLGCQALRGPILSACQLSQGYLSFGRLY